jgi:hypothetical protein
MMLKRTPVALTREAARHRGQSKQSLETTPTDLRLDMELILSCEGYTVDQVP